MNKLFSNSRYIELSKSGGSNIVPGSRSIFVRPNSISFGQKLAMSSLYDRMKLAEIPFKDIMPIVLAFNYNCTPDES